MQHDDHLIPHRETETEIPETALDREHEQRDLGIGWLFTSLLILAVLVGVTILGMGLLFGVLEGRQAARAPSPSPMLETPAQPPEPRLESRSGEVLETLRAREEILLDSYVWIDREAGQARIPVDRAIDILADRGLPWRGAAAESRDATDGDGAPESEQ